MGVGNMEARTIVEVGCARTEHEEIVGQAGIRNQHRGRLAPRPDIAAGRRLVEVDGLLLGRAVRVADAGRDIRQETRSEEHTSELQSLMRISYAVFCLTNKNSQSKSAEHNS